MDLSPKIDYAAKWSMPQCPPPPPRPVYETHEPEPESASAPRMLRLPSFSRLSLSLRSRSSSQQPQQRGGGFMNSTVSDSSADGDMGFFVDLADEPNPESERPLPRFTLKPRPSKSSPVSSVRAMFNSVRSSTSSGLTRVASSPLFARRPSTTSASKPSKRPSMSRRPSMNFMGRRPSFSLSRSPSFSLSRCPSFSRAA